VFYVSLSLRPSFFASLRPQSYLQSLSNPPFPCSGRTGISSLWRTDAHFVDQKTDVSLFVARFMIRSSPERSLTRSGAPLSRAFAIPPLPVCRFSLPASLVIFDPTPYLLLLSPASVNVLPAAVLLSSRGFPNRGPSRSLPTWSSSNRFASWRLLLVPLSPFRIPRLL